MIKIAHAVYDENKKSSGGKPGDQTGREVAIWDWYTNEKKGKPWTHVFRAKDPEVAKKISKTAQAIVANDNVGYDQSNRTTLYDQAVKVDFDISKIKTACETDCSGMVSVCINAAGVKISKSIYTGNQLAAIKATKQFDILTDKKYLTSSDYLQDGDILFRVGHTAVAVNYVTVKELQHALNIFGYGLKEDGIKGKMTNLAIDDLHNKVQAIDDMLTDL